MQPKEPLVSVIGPADHKDIFDVQSGLRFHEGIARGVPLELAEKLVRERKGYEIHHVTYEPIKKKG